ncbi:MAG: DNA repair protein RadC, partial [Desulfuromonadales bacterium]|nr:DNA repair protein RadC [Desulfuromonadales bacterium]
ITKRLKDASELLGIRLLDHVIVGETYYSFADNGEL